MTPRGVSPRQLRWLAGVWIGVGLVVLVWGFVQVFGGPAKFLVAPILLGTIIIYVLSPVVDAFTRRGLPRVLATLLTYVLVLGVLAASVWLLVPVFAEQLQALADELPDILIGLRRGLVQWLEPLGFEDLVPGPDEGQDPAEWVSALVDANGDQVVGVLSWARALVGSLVSSVVAVILAPVLAFYVLADLPRISAGLQRLLPPEQREEVTDVGRRILSSVGAYFRGQLLVAAFVGVATSIGLALVGLPFWAIVGGLAGLFNLIPFIGPFVGGVLGVVVALTVGEGVAQAIVVVVVMVVVQQIDNHAITPAVLSRSVHVHPVTIIISLSVAASMLGLLGMLVAIPAVAAGKLVLLYLLATRVPAMQHLSDPERFLDEPDLPPAREGSLTSLSQQLRRTWEARRFGDGNRRSR